MKWRVAILFILFTNSIGLFAQEDLVKNTKIAIKSANTKELSKYFNESVNLKLAGEEGVYSKAQGEIVIKDFLKKYTVTDFQVIHQGQSKEGALHYVVGKYTHTRGSLRVYMLIKQFHGNFLIDTLDFSEE